MKRSIKYIFIFFILLYACDHREQRSDGNKDLKEIPIAVETQGVPVSPDSISKPLVNEAKAPMIISVKEVAILPYNDNVHEALPPSVVTLDPNYVKEHLIPIKDTPTIVSANGRTIACVLSEPIPISTPRFRDEAVCNIQYVDVTQGFFSSYVRRLFQDKNENIWVTSEEGFVKYDGKSIEKFSEKNSILKDTWPRLKEDSEGNIWMATNNGLLKYNGVYFTVFDTLSGFPDNRVRSVEILGDNIWTLTPKGLTCFDGKKFTTYDKRNGFDLTSTTFLMADRSKKLWCGSSTSGIYCFDGKGFIQFDKNSGMGSNSAICGAQDLLGNIWIAGDEGVTKFDGRTFERYTDKQGLINNTVRSILADRKGNVWFSAFHGGMSCFDGKKFTWYTEKEGLTVNTVVCMLEDKNGNIWAGTEGGGLCRFTKNSFKHFTDKEIENKIVMGVGEDQKSNIYLGTYGGGLCKYNGKKIVVMKDKNQVLDIVFRFYCDKKGCLWMIIPNVGFVRYDGKQFEHYTTVNGLFSHRLTSVMEDKDGNMWFGSDEQGAIMFNGKQFIRYGKEQGLNSNYVLNIQQDKEGNMWFATANGLNKMVGKKIFSFKEEQGLLSNSIRNLLIDRSGGLWIGTSNKGVNRYDGKYMMSITKEEGLTNNSIRSIIEDKEVSIKNGNVGVWISTDFGINHLLLKNNGHSLNDVELFTYGRQDGLRGEDFTSNSGLMDSKGRAWWGSIKGLTTLQTTDIPIDRDIPEIHLNSISLEQSFIDFNSLKDSISANKDWPIGERKQTNLKNIHFTGVPSFRNYPENLELPYNINNITFNYSAINWLNGHKLRYQYILEGSDMEWHPITTETRAVYTDLDHGTYTFKVRARGVLEVWSKSFEYKFVILPPWWKTIWAYVIYALVFIASAVIYLKWRTRALLKRQKELEHIIIERTADVVEEKTKVEGKNKIIEEKQKEIFDSLQYARQIQKLLLANHKLVNETLPDSFVVFKPKDIVSGDFYWAAKKEDRLYLAVCDSTGHGVPGAFMSLLNINFLNEAITEKNIVEPNEVFNYVRKRLVDNISQDGRQDGMDGILICVKEGSKKITYAAANNAPVIVINNELSVLGTDKMPVGKGEKNEPFKLYRFEMKKGDELYLYTDGFADQFGGPKGKKYKYKPLNDLILKNHHLPVTKQEELLFSEFENWKGDLEQVDDVCILGIRF